MRPITGDPVTRHPATGHPALRRLLAWPTAALCLTGAVSACGSQPAPAGPAASASVAAPCPVSSVRLRLDPSAAGAAAGTSRLPLDLTNVTTAPCVLAGAVAVSFAASRSGGSVVGAPGTADPGASVARVVLAPGDSAHLWLGVASAANVPADRCRPTPAAGFRVRLPGWQAPAFVPGTALTCARIVQGSQMLTIGPLARGLARRGAA